MICAFFGVVISLERAVAIGRIWAYAGSLLAGLGGIATIAGALGIAPWLFLLGSLVLLAATLVAGWPKSTVVAWMMMRSGSNVVEVASRPASSTTR